MCGVNDWEAFCEEAMKDASRKRLTKYLEEFLHDYVKMHGCSCGFESDHSLAMYNHIKRNPNRTFTTGNDMLDLKEKIVEMGEWVYFIEFSRSKWVNDETALYEGPNDTKGAAFTRWLFTMPRFAELVDEFLKEKEKSHE